MSDEETPGVPDSTDTLKHVADKVAISADKVVEQLAALQQELHDATEKANADIATAKAKAAADVALERKDRRRAAVKFAVVVGLDVVLSLVSLGLYISQGQTNRRLEESLHQNYLTAQQQQVTRVRVLCPLYEVLLTAASSPNPEATQTPQQKARLASALATIEDGYRTLGCKPTLSGKN